ncbi:hypothetical protein chiPu_0015517 [Chiloscyllium punctatum]|uniref:Threonine synthase N-terminal domain-containing protein n=1 Tax=Chiloscyllium punctatum TaxID=137246 RepID=A0A401T359_CHIPU|nr:hypothetical protein [Chiloscyllium punctatum]
MSPDVSWRPVPDQVSIGAYLLFDCCAKNGMKYTSTRGGLTGVNFEQVLFSGYAPDGGLFMPEEIPSLDTAILQTWSTYSYPRLVEEICSLFISRDDLPREDLRDLISQAFVRFRHKDIVKLAKLKNELYVLELWHGVTFAFKDLAMSCVGQLLQYFLRKRQKHVTILVGTSGDTGSSAIESIRGMENMDIIVLLPHGRCSPIQELQMTTVIEDNVHVFAVDGTSDELDEPIRNVFADPEFVKRHNIMSLNSINWARIMVQIAHYFYAYFQCSPSMQNIPLPLVELSQTFDSYTVNDDYVIVTMLRCWKENEYLLCPHSAVAVAYHYQEMDLDTRSVPRCCLATAAAAKFPEAVLKAGLTPEIPPEIRALETMDTRCTAMKRGEDWEKILYHKIEEVNMRRKT